MFGFVSIVPGHFKAGPDFGISHPTHGGVVGAVLFRASSWISRILVRTFWDFMVSVTSLRNSLLPREVG